MYAATIGLTQNYMFGVNLCSNYRSNPENMFGVNLCTTIGLTQNYMFGGNLCSNNWSNPELYIWGQSMQQLEV